MTRVKEYEPIAEVGHFAGFLENSRLKLATKVAPLLGVAAFAGAVAPQAEASPPMKYIGVVENQIWSPDLGYSRQIAAEAKEAGFNTIEIRLPYSPWQKYVEGDDLSRLCNAAEAAYEQDMTLNITTQGFFAPNKQGEALLGYSPKTAKEVRDYKQYLSHIMWSLAGPNKCEVLRKNKVNAEKLILSIFNEPNIDTFWADQDSAPEDYIRLLAAVYPFLQKERLKIAKSTGKPIDVQVFGGAWSSHRDALGFIRRMKPAVQELRQNHYNGKFADVIVYHPYATSSSESPTTKHDDGFMGIADYPKLLTELTDALGYTPKLIYNEYGVITKIPPNMRSIYGGDTPAGMAPVDEATQTQYLSEAVYMTACQPNLEGIGNMLLRDQITIDGWHSGLEYANGVKKSSFEPMKAVFKAATDGNIPGCDELKPPAATTAKVNGEKQIDIVKRSILQQNSAIKKSAPKKP
jgi:hypothetical protein